MHLDNEDYDLIRLTMVELATSSASLDRSPNKNWVENAGQLPPYVRKLARAIEKSGHTLSSAISIAISRIKVWAAGGDDVEADTRAKAVKALAQWEALKAKNAAKKLTKLSREDGSEYLQLSNVGSFNTEMVRRSWDAQQRADREAYRLANPGTSRDYDAVPYTWIRELWTDFIVIESESKLSPAFLKIPYTVDDKGVVTFGEPEEVKLVWKDAQGELSRTEKDLLKDVLVK